MNICVSYPVWTIKRTERKKDFENDYRERRGWIPFGRKPAIQSAVIISCSNKRNEYSIVSCDVICIASCEVVLLDIIQNIWYAFTTGAGVWEWAIIMGLFHNYITKYNQLLSLGLHCVKVESMWPSSQLNAFNFDSRVKQWLRHLFLILNQIYITTPLQESNWKKEHCLIQ